MVQEPTLEPPVDENPKSTYPGGMYPGAFDVLPGVFKPNAPGKPGSSSQGKDSMDDYWTTKNEHDQVILPGMLSGIVTVERETTSKEAEDIQWGDTKETKLYHITKKNHADIPKTEDRTDLNGRLLIFTSSIAALAVMRRRKRDKEYDRIL